MCGICGIVDWSGKPVDADLVRRMRDLMLTRGPDDAGLYLADGIALGHRRLSIIDLSPAGHQPMSNEDQSIWVVLNGEIYNFQELRDELLARGHHFHSRTDTEVLVHGFEQWGLDTLCSRLRGMFALAIWDARRREVHLARDHLGKKPLFYQIAGPRLLFASDIKCLWLAANGALPLDEQALDEYLYYYFITQERSIYRDVRKLSPAHLASFSSAGMTLHRYWQPDYSGKTSHSTGDWIEGIEHHVDQAVRRRLLADVPLGAFLSGGVDSSVICATMARVTNTPPQTFSVAFPGVADYDESAHARTVARHIGSDHHELAAESGLFADLPRLVWHYGEPFGDSSAVATCRIAQAAHQHVRVVLTGDGGDEAFGGYPRYDTAGRDLRLNWLPRALRCKALPALADTLAGWLPRSLLARRGALFTHYAAARPDAVAENLCWWDGLRHALYTDEWRRRLGDFHPLTAQLDLLNQLSGPTQVDRALEYVLRVRLPSDYLVKVDVATMAHSLEARCPFLDLDLLEFAASIPASALLQGRIGKPLLKRYAEKLVPHEVIHRPKQGFALPIGHWFRSTQREVVQGLLFSQETCCQDYFDSDVVAAVWAEHLAGKRDHTHRLWALLIFEVWLRLFVSRTLEPDTQLTV